MELINESLNEIMYCTYESAFFGYVYNYIIIRLVLCHLYS